METLPAHEMAVRLCFLFDHYDKHPVREDLHGWAPTWRTASLLSHNMRRRDTSFSPKSALYCHGCRHNL